MIAAAIVILAAALFYAGAIMSTLNFTITALVAAIAAAANDRDKARADAQKVQGDLDVAKSMLITKEQELATVRQQLADAEADALTDAEVDALNAVGPAIGLNPPAPVVEPAGDTDAPIIIEGAGAPENLAPSTPVIGSADIAAAVKA
jgi:hypothetical protein